MSAHGINDVTFAILDDGGAVVTDADKGLSADGIYLADSQGEGFTQANITGIETAGTIQWANNKAKRTSQGKSQPQIALTALELNFLVSMKIKGFVSDSKGGFVRSLPKPHVAILIHSQSLDGDIDIYEGFNNTNLIEAASNHSTDNTAEADYNTALEAQALTPLKEDIFVDTKGIQQPYKVWRSDQTGFDKAAMYSEVFGGYKLATPAEHTA